LTKIRSTSDYILTPELLTEYIPELEGCDELKDSKINVISELKSGRPVKRQVGVDEDGVPEYIMEFQSITNDNKNMVSVKFNEKVKFAPIVNVYSISLGPDIWDLEDAYNGEINSVRITPTIYDLTNFTPKKRVVLTFSPETAQDSAMKIIQEKLKETDQNEERKEFVVKTKDELEENIDIAESMMSTVSKDEIRKTIKDEENKYLESLIDMVRDALTNPLKYLPPAKKSIILRVTEDSILPNEEVIRDESETTVTM
jgi:hypothetical protein